MALNPTLIQIRERSTTDLFDLTLVLVRSRPLTIGLAALAGVVPFALFNAWLTADGTFPLTLFVGLVALEVPWATAPLTVVLGGMMFGARPSARQVAVTIARRLPALLVYQLVVRALLIAVVLAYPIVPIRLSFLDEVILLERGPFRDVLRRCSALTGTRGSELFGFWVAQLVYGSVFVACFWMGSGVLLNIMFRSDLTWDEPGWGDLYRLPCQAAVWIAVSFFGVARFLAYIDQRIRLEGWEVKVRLQGVGRAMEEADRW